MEDFRFVLSHQDKRTLARSGIIHTPHGIIQTPAFVPVGTQATVKSLTPDDLASLGVELFIVNTYHTYLRPGVEVIKKCGGLHRFMHWSKPLMTDSGGFQVFSLARNKNFGTTLDSGLPAGAFSEAGDQRIKGNQRIKRDEDSSPAIVNITDDGVEFQSHWDGASHLFTPEKSMEIQNMLGADITLAFDDCTPYPVTKSQARKSLSRTHFWAERSLKRFHTLYYRSPAPRQALYGIVQGSVFEDLRKESARKIVSMDFDGFAIGGVSVGESKQEMKKVLTWVVPQLPKGKPRHLLGVGEIDDIFTLVEQGIDTFDCVQPTRLARMGHLYVMSNVKDSREAGSRSARQMSKRRKFMMDITKRTFNDDQRPIVEHCQCYTCQSFSRAYIHHLFRVRELLAYRLATIHNVYFVQRLVADIGRSIAEDRFLDLKHKWLYN